MGPAEQLRRWVALKHAGQQIKFTGEPYFNHLAEVAEMAAPATGPGYEVGLCHDLLEKTPTSQNEFYNALLSFSYSPEQAAHIVGLVIELTDVFTKAAYPGLSKRARKENESDRLLRISAGAQTVKYCDLIYNIKWMIKHDRPHAEKYLKRKQQLLAGMNLGNQGLRQTALININEALLTF